MSVELVSKAGETVHLGLFGRLDTAGVAEIETQFFAHLGPSTKHAIVDLNGVEFVASMGIRIFVTAAKTLAKRGGRLVLLNPQELVRESLESTGIGQAIPIVDELTEAERVVEES